jgi:hypothetical protein
MVMEGGEEADIAEEEDGCRVKVDGKRRILRL